jgi:pullulanase/glycogen debranching enzyme
MEILRSKSLDRDSYRSGDWFNFLDYSYQSNNWGVGLPFEDINHANWDIMRALLADPALKPASEHMHSVLNHFEHMLQIRMSSPLFRMRTAAEIQKSVKFHNTGPHQKLGLIVMSVHDQPDKPLDPHLKSIFALFNSAPKSIKFKLKTEAVGGLKLHPILANAKDPVVKTATFDPAKNQFMVPGRTTVVFIAEQD